VTTAISTDLTGPLVAGRYHFLLRRLHSFTGMFFGMYLIVHLVVNATIAQGAAYQRQVMKIHDLPFLPVVEWTFIYLPILYHTIYGIWITLTGQPNVASYPFGKNWLYLMQRISAVIIFFFVLFHVLALKYGWFGTNLEFSPHEALQTIIRHVQSYKWIAYGVYPIGILAACFHLANGFWTAGITWGLTVGAVAQRRWGFICTLLFIISFGAGMIALVASLVTTPEMAAQIMQSAQK